MIRTLITEKRRAGACHQRARLPSHKKIYNHLANSLKKTLARHKYITLVNNLSNLSSKDGSLWKATKKILRYKPSKLPLIKHDCSLTSSDSEKAELFKLHLYYDILPHTDIFDPDTMLLVNRSLNVPPQSSLPIKAFSPNDLKYQIQKYPKNNAPGYDLITAEVIKCLPKRSIVHTTHIFNSIIRFSYFPLLWKFSTIIIIQNPNKPADSTSSYRPISLLPLRKY